MNKLSISFAAIRSLKSFFIRYVAFTLTLIVITLVWFAYETYSYHISSKRSDIELAINKTEMSFVGIFNYAESVTNYINKQISASDVSDAEISKILSSFKQENYDDTSVKEVLSVSMFSWVNKHKLLTISSETGILEHPINMTNRDYLQRTVQTPWKLCIGAPVKGAVSKQFVIPAGVGVESIGGKYIGTVVLGFDVKNLTKKLSNNLRFKGMNFAILDQNDRAILMSENDASFNNEFINKALSSSGENQDGVISEFSFLHPNHDFLLIKTIDKYPYKIIAGYPNGKIAKELFFKLIPYLLVFVVIVALFALTSYFLKSSIIQPFSQLSRIAELISRNKAENITNMLPQTNVKEINNLGKQLELIQEYKIELVSAKSSQERFFANMSHELRTPLNGILNFTYMMEKEMFGPLNEEYKELLGDIHSSGKHLLNLLNDILDFAKMDVGKMQLNEEEFEIAQELKQTIKIIAPDAKQKGVTIHTDIEHGLRMFRGNRRFFKQICLNLLSNASKFTESGDDIKVSLKISGEYLILEVKDTGIGIKAEDMEKVVKDFGQVGDGYKRGKHQGTGLGLVITKKMVELHEGKFTIESIFHKGTTVRVLFPSKRVVIIA